MARLIAAGQNFSIAVRENGQLVGWGDPSNDMFVAPASLSSAQKITSGRYHSVAILGDGSVVAWGSSSLGRLDIPSGLGGVTDISAGHMHTLALKSDGTVVSWGTDNKGQVSVPAGLTGVVAVSAGTYHSLALKSDGTVVGWGDNYNGQSTAPYGLSGVVGIAAGDKHSLALKSDGTVVQWGYNEQGVPAGLSGVVQVSAGVSISVALKSDGTIVTWGYVYDDRLPPPSGISGVEEVVCGYTHTLYLYDGGFVGAWGVDTDGQTEVPESAQPSDILYAELGFNAAFDGFIKPEGLISASLVASASFEGGQDGQLGTFSAMLPLSASASARFGWRGGISAALEIGFTGSGYQDWLSKIPPIQLQEVYRLVITGAADGLSDLHIGGISSWQATNQAGGRSSYVQAVIPAAEALLPDIQARQNGELVIQKGYKFSTGATRYEEILRSRFDTLRPDRGQRALTVTVSGYLPARTAFSGSRTLTGIRSVSIQNAKRRVRCDIDLFLQPGMAVDAMGESFRAGYINYYVSQTDKFCEVGER